jgi:hypothetical protein
MAKADLRILQTEMCQKKLILVRVLYDFAYCPRMLDSMVHSVRARIFRGQILGLILSGLLSVFDSERGVFYRQYGLYRQRLQIVRSEE